MDRIIVEDSQNPERFPKFDHIELGSDGWLSPKVDYYKVGTTEHDESAIFLVTSSDEVRREEKEAFRIFPSDKQEYDQRNDREKLKQLGWILIRGIILRSEDALNYTPEQLKKISDAGIRIVSVYEGSKEYSSKELLENLNEIKDKLQRSEIIKQVEDSLVGQERNSFRRQTLNDIKGFIENPLRKSIFVGEFSNYFLEHAENGHEILPTEIFNILSFDFSEEMTVNIGRYIRRYRVINLKENEKLIIQRNEYHHGGQSRDTSADIENSISMFVVDPHTISNKFKRLIYAGVTDSEKNPKIKLSNKEGYFSEIIKDLITKP